MKTGSKNWMLRWANKTRMLLLPCFCCCCKKYDNKKKEENDIDDSQRTAEEEVQENEETWKRAKSILESYKVLNMETILPTYYEWSIEQDRIHAKQQNKDIAYYGPIGGSETFNFWGDKVQVQHCTTKSILDLGLTSYSVVASMMSADQKNQLRSWLDFELLDDDKDNMLSLDEISKSLIMSLTPTSLGTIINVTIPTTGHTIDLSDYDDW